METSKTNKKVLSTVDLNTHDLLAEAGITEFDTIISNGQPVLTLETSPSRVARSKEKKAPQQPASTSKVGSSKSKAKGLKPEIAGQVLPELTREDKAITSPNPDVIKESKPASKSKTKGAIANYPSSIGFPKGMQPVNSAPKVSDRRKPTRAHDGNRIQKPNMANTVLPKDVSETATDILWQTAVASKAKKPAEAQVWLDNDLYRKIEMFNIKHGKPVPTKHVVNAILQMFLDEHKPEISKESK